LKKEKKGDVNLRSITTKANGKKKGRTLFLLTRKRRNHSTGGEEGKKDLPLSGGVPSFKRKGEIRTFTSRRNGGGKNRVKFKSKTGEKKGKGSNHL